MIEDGQLPRNPINKIIWANEQNNSRLTHRNKMCPCVFPPRISHFGAEKRKKNQKKFKSYT